MKTRLVLNFAYLGIDGFVLIVKNKGYKIKFGRPIFESKIPRIRR